MNVETFELIYESYITYVEKHFGTDAIVVFDGYENNAKSIKSSERQRRRLKKKCSDVKINLMYLIFDLMI